MSNHVSLKNDLIETAYIGDQTYDTIMPIVEQTKQIAKQLRDRGRPVLILVDTTAIGRTGEGVQRASRQALKSFDFDRIAVFGGSNFVAAIVPAIASMLGIRNLRYFADEAAARRWLAQDA
jgi:UDP-N-acetylmuramyl pentapeptide synthase